MKTFIDKQTNVLLLELMSIQKENVKEIEITKQELKQEIMLLESFKKYCEELTEKGTSFEISHVANDLHRRATELQESSVVLKEYGFTDVTFTATDLQDLLAAQRCNLIGTIGVQSSSGLKFSFT